MNNAISKIRARRTKNREKSAVKPSPDGSRPEQKALGALLVLLFWLLTLFIIRGEYFLSMRYNPETLMRVAGEAIFLITSLFAFGLIIRLIKSDLLCRNSWIVLVCLISLISLVTSKITLHFSGESQMISGEVALFLMPVVFPALTATILLGGGIGVAVGLWNSLVLAIMMNYNLPIMITGLVASAVAAKAAQNARTRPKVLRAAVITAVIQTACVSAHAWITPEWLASDPVLLAKQFGACIASGFLSGVAALLLLPFFQFAFGITTNLALLDLSDLGHPLLQRLAIEAPGTYHHSLIVASLAQASADRIGANSLLTRVASYFHDIGKLVKPLFFTENMGAGENPHDDLTPSMSTLIITNHVKEGISLALLHKIPTAIIDIIREHHGTGLISYFHHKAREQMGLAMDTRTGNSNTPKVDEQSFRYGGPKPSTRESAIICLADAVEAASRSLEKPSPGAIENLVNEIINSRFEDGQLDECNLTFSELAEIRESFISTMTSMLHSRIPYPKNESKDKQQPKTSPGEQGKDQEASSPADENGRKN